MRTVLEDAADAIDGPRAEAYGDPYDTAVRFARIASAVTGLDIKPRHMAELMLCVKLARIKTTTKFHRDTWVDIAGYARVGEIIDQHRARARVPSNVEG